MLASTQSQACLLMILQTSYSPPSLGQASHLEPLTKELELQTQIACKLRQVIYLCTSITSSVKVEMWQHLPHGGHERLHLFTWPSVLPTVSA